jgi:hypothetical protein
MWTKEKKEDANELFWPYQTEDEEPTIQLLDQNLSVVLESGPSGERLALGSSEDRHLTTAQHTCIGFSIVV